MSRVHCGNYGVVVPPARDVHEGGERAGPGGGDLAERGGHQTHFTRQTHGPLLRLLQHHEDIPAGVCARWGRVGGRCNLLRCNVEDTEFPVFSSLFFFFTSYSFVFIITLRLFTCSLRVWFTVILASL